MSRPPVGAVSRERIRRAVRTEALRPAPAEVNALVVALKDRFGPAFVAALFYGSCRRQVALEGIVDLHVLVTDLRQALGRVAGTLCRLLPPNVYYLEVSVEGRPVRCKYAVLSVAQFRRRCSRTAYHSYFWGRYAQPVTLLGTADPEPFVDELAHAVETLAWRALPLVPRGADWRALWTRALSLSYRTELRPETENRARTLVDAFPHFFEEVGRAVLAVSAKRQRFPVLGRVDWALRIALGKILSVLRLLKALYTFDGGIDYVAWKLERHTGKPVEIPDKVRRRPLLYLWPLLVRLWRQGTFR